MNPLCFSRPFRHTDRKITTVVSSITIFAAMKGSGLIKLFAKSQISSVIGTIADYSVMVALTELAGIYYVISTAIGAAVGAVVNFNLNRHWTYRATEGGVSRQALKYILVSGMSLALNSGGVYLVTEYAQIDYKISRIIVGVLVAIGFNFVLHKTFVFK